MNLDQKTFGHLFSLVRIIYQALTEKALLFKSEVRGPRKNVISDVTSIQGRKPRLVVWLRTGVSSGNRPTNVIEKAQKMPQASLEG